MGELNIMVWMWRNIREYAAASTCSRRVDAACMGFGCWADICTNECIGYRCKGVDMEATGVVFKSV